MSLEILLLVEVSFEEESFDGESFWVKVVDTFDRSKDEFAIEDSFAIFSSSTARSENRSVEFELSVSVWFNCESVTSVISVLLSRGASVAVESDSAPAKVVTSSVACSVMFSSTASVVAASVESEMLTAAASSKVVSVKVVSSLVVSSIVF